MPQHPAQRGSSNLLAHQLRLFARRLKRHLRDNSDTGDLKPSQVALLHRLEDQGPATTSALARAGGMRSQSMGPIVASLEAAGLVAISPDPTDGRQNLVALTDHCRTWLADGRATRQDWLSRAIDSRLSPDEQAILAQAVPLILRVVAQDDEI